MVVKYPELDEGSVTVKAHVPVIRCMLLNPIDVVRGVSDMSDTVLDQKISRRGVFWKGVTERTLLEASGSTPLLHRRIVVRSPVRLPGTQPVHVSGGKWLRPTSFSAGLDKNLRRLSTELFGGDAVPSSWMTKRVMLDGATVMEDKVKTYNAMGPGGFARNLKFWNGFAKHTKYEDEDSFASSDASFTNVYLVDVFGYGQCSPELNAQFLEPIESVGKQEAQRAPAKRIKTDVEMSGTGAGIGQLSLSESVSVTSSYTFYWNQIH